MTTHKSPLDEAIENLVARGDVEVVGHEEGKPVYYLTEAGLQRHAFKDRTADRRPARAARFEPARRGAMDLIAARSADGETPKERLGAASNMMNDNAISSLATRFQRDGSDDR